MHLFSFGVAGHSCLGSAIHTLERNNVGSSSLLYHYGILSTPLAEPPHLENAGVDPG